MLAETCSVFVVFWSRMVQAITNKEVSMYVVIQDADARGGESVLCILTDQSKAKMLASQLTNTGKVMTLEKAKKMFSELSNQAAVQRLLIA